MGLSVRSVEEGTDRILGAHIQGSEAGEVINLLALGIRSGMLATDLKHMLFAYPMCPAILPWPSHFSSMVTNLDSGRGVERLCSAPRNPRTTAPAVSRVRSYQNRILPTTREPFLHDLMNMVTEGPIKTL
jgi:hypothetical protein